MRIHTDILEPKDFTVALDRAGLKDVWINNLSVHGSRKRIRGYEVRLGAEHKKGRRRPMHAPSGCTYYAATHDEHGAWTARLYELDPDAIVGPYKNVDDFNWATAFKYEL